jgi:hypothetical protein
LSQLLDGQSHADIARAILRGDFDAADKFLGAITLQGIVQGAAVVLVSSDEFSNLGSQPDLLRRFNKQCLECFDSVEYVAISRNLKSLTYNQIRQAITHFAFNFWDNDDYASRMVQYVVASQSAFKELLGDALRIHSYDQLLDSSEFCNGLLRVCVPEIGANQRVISEIPFDATDLTRFDVYSLFGALVRAAVAKNQNSNPYSPAVQSELERLLPRETMQTFAASIDVQRIGYLVSQMIGGIAAQTQQSLRGPNGGYSGDAITPDLASALEYSIRDQ